MKLFEVLQGNSLLDEIDTRCDRYLITSKKTCLYLKSFVSSKKSAIIFGKTKTLKG